MGWLGLQPITELSEICTLSLYFVLMFSLSVLSTRKIVGGNVFSLTYALLQTVSRGVFSMDSWILPFLLTWVSRSAQCAKMSSCAAYQRQAECIILTA